MALRWTIRKKMYMGYSIILAIFVVLGCVFIYHSMLLRRNAERITANKDVMEITGDIRLKIPLIVVRVKGSALEDDRTVVDEHARPFFTDTKAGFAKLKKIYADDAAKIQTLKAMDARLDALWEIGERMVDAYLEDFEKGRVLKLGLDGKMGFRDQALALVGSVMDFHGAALEENKILVDDLTEMASLSLRTSILALLVSLMVVAVFAISITRSITKPLSRVMDTAQQVIKGNYNQKPLGITSTDEVGQLANVFDSMLSELRLLARQADAMAKGDLSAEVLQKEVAGDLGHSFKFMVSQFRILSAQADILAKGDLSAKVLQKEVAGDLGHSFKIMVENLGTLIPGSKGVGVQTALSAAELLATSQGLSFGVQRQSSILSAVSSAMTEMSASIQEVSSSSSNAARLAGEMAVAASDGLSALMNTSRGFDAIKKSSEETGTRTQALAEASATIGEIVGAIQEISQQTNLLALNAAIEAAHAGVQGKGFAVVADEVRKLAERSSRSAAEIGAINTKIQEEIRQERETTARGAMVAAEGVQFAEDLTATFETIRQRVSETHRAISEITIAINRQIMTSSQVVSSVDSANNVVAEVLRSTEQIVKQGNSLHTVVQSLESSLGQFQV